MDDDDAAELARLRERAYGRSADIAEDAAALARLRELEARAAESAIVASAAPDEEPAPAATEPPEPEPHGRVEARPARTRPRWVTVTALLVGAAALVVATTAVALSIPREAPRYANAVPVETLRALEPWPPQSDSDSTRYADFRGFSVFASTVGTTADPNPVRCLSIVSPDEAADPTIGETLSSCGAGPFPVAVTAVVSTLSPQDAQDAYALGTAINFTLGESGVEVWVASR